MSSGIPMDVLSERLSDRIAGRKVRAAVFTTFSFDPGFFELHVLPLLFDQPFSQADKVRRILLEDAMEQVDDIAVYYDHSALSQDAEPARLDYRRIDTHRSTGCFHPKVILLLVDEQIDPDEVDGRRGRSQSLIFSVMSANLTLSGWWENIECAHFEEIRDKVDDASPCSYRKDLLSFINTLKNCCEAGEDHSALDKIHRFVRKRVPRDQPKKRVIRGRYLSRLFFGQGNTSFSEWLSGFNLEGDTWNMEVISPFFSKKDAGPLPDLIEAIQPKETRVYLPRDDDGTALVSHESYEDIAKHAKWGELPVDVTNRGRTATAERLPPRKLHAKVYRLWSRRLKKDLLIIGSVNLSKSAHSHSRAGNLEAAMLIDVSDLDFPRSWWLELPEADASSFVKENPAEEDGLDDPTLDISLSFDWGSKKLSYRLLNENKRTFEVCEVNGHRIFQVENARTGEWVECGAEAAAAVENVLKSSSFLLIRHEGGDWRVLVREENMAYRPSLLKELTPEEILEYWSLLTPAQRAPFIENRLGADQMIEGLPVSSHDPNVSTMTIFDRFAGIYHAFGCRGRFIKEAIEDGRDSAAEYRLTGEKYYSLPVLLQKTLDACDEDPVTSYVTFLCAQQLLDNIKSLYPKFYNDVGERKTHLENLLQELPKIRKAIPLNGINDSVSFFGWYESQFLKDLSTQGGGS